MGHREVPVIVVGVDGTPASKSALAFAMREAARRGSVIEVVTVWDWDGTPPAMPPPTTPEDARTEAQAIQDAAVAETLLDVDAPPMLTRQVVQGNPAESLLQAAKSADYLVVGTGRKGTLRRALLGSVSEYCVRRATCPVVVVPVPDEPVGKAHVSTGGEGFAQPA